MEGWLGTSLGPFSIATANLHELVIDKEKEFVLAYDSDTGKLATTVPVSSWLLLEVLSASRGRRDTARGAASHHSSLLSEPLTQRKSLIPPRGCQV